MFFYKNTLLLVLIALIIVAISCKQTLLNDKYNLQNPDQIIQLSKSLTEISGLTYIGNGKIAAVQDEKGQLFIIDTKTGEVISKDKFGKNGDYEGIALVGNTVYSVESTGTIHQISLSGKVKELEKYNTKLSGKNDVEGLCYHAPSNSLLLACKGQSGKKKHKKGVRSVYAFDLKKSKLHKRPFLEISEEEIGEKLGRNMIGKFQPSGITIAPEDGKIYIISSAGNAIAIYNENKQLEQALTLSKSDFAQPEGICFDENGTLYISNEGRDGRANILVFKKNT